jgi:hypothetical protein
VSKSHEPLQPGLDEVERALSLLEGRHPEHERTRRETLAAAEQRRHAIARELGTRARRRRRRLLVIALNVVAFGLAAHVAWRLVTRSRALHAQLVRTEAPFAETGWVETASNVLSASGSLETDLPGSSCFVALSTDERLLRVHQRERPFEAPQSVGFCSCAPGRVVIETVARSANPTSTTGPVGLALLRIDARSIGGPLGRVWLPVAPRAWGDGGAECQDALLDAWIADGHGPAPPIDEAWLDGAPARSSLRAAGFRVVSGVPAGRPFGIVTTRAGDCILAVAATPDPVSLRSTGGARPIAGAPGALAWCGSEAATMTVWREGTSPVVVLAAQAAAVGGLLGVRECAEAARVDLPVGAIALSDADLAWDAGLLLRASVRESRPQESAAALLPLEPGPPGARLVALALSPGARVASDPASAQAACDPPLGATPSLRESVCVHAAPATWWRKGDDLAAVARGPLPFWLSSLEASRESDALAQIAKILTLARRLGASGFAPTLLEGVTELADGVRVVGRADEDAIVAIGLGPTSPWVFPFTDSVPWSLGESPPVIPLKPGESAKLTSVPLPNAALERRRTVVFRHIARP